MQSFTGPKTLAALLNLNHPVDYSQDWPRQYDVESDLIYKTLDETVSRLHHIGSTAVIGLIAKPIIDILGESNDIAALSQKVNAMNNLGYSIKADYGISHRAYFSKTTGTPVHLHIFRVGSFQIEKHLFFRDYLRTFPEARLQYQNIKTELFKQNITGEQYQSGKSDLIRLLTIEAYRWKKTQLPTEF